MNISDILFHFLNFELTDPETSYEYAPESTASNQPGGIAAETFSDIILRILLKTREHTDDATDRSRDLSKTGQWNGFSYPPAPPRYNGFSSGVGRVGIGTTTANFDKRGRCRGKRCRGVGLNPNASLRPLPFGKRSLEENQSTETVSAKRGKIKGRLRHRVLSRKEFLPFGRR